LHVNSDKEIAEMLIIYAASVLHCEGWFIDQQQDSSDSNTGT
jgi:hypothetical protein